MTLVEAFSPPLLEKKLPAALIAALLLQTAAALFWAGSAAQRIADLERTRDRDQAAIERVAVLGEQIAEIRAATARIETKIDKQKGE